MNITNVPYSREEPAFVVAWVKDFVTTLFEKKEIFIASYVEEIKPSYFEMNYKGETFEIELKFEFIVADE